MGRGFWKEKRRERKQKVIAKILAFTTAAIASIIVVAALGSAFYYAGTHICETLGKISLSVLNGIGVAVGGMLGSLLLMRFKTARSFLKNFVKDIQDGR